jgi:hypothetical protein
MKDVVLLIKISLVCFESYFNEKEEGEILNSVLLIYRHFKLGQQIAKKMELLCINNLPLIWHWLNTKSSTVNVFELKYAKR